MYKLEKNTGNCPLLTIYLQKIMFFFIFFKKNNNKIFYSKKYFSKITLMELPKIL